MSLDLDFRLAIRLILRLDNVSFLFLVIAAERGWFFVCVFDWLFGCFGGVVLFSLFVFMSVLRLSEGTDHCTGTVAILHVACQ